MAAAAGLSAFGPAVMVSGCLQVPQNVEAEEATEFTLREVKSAANLTETPAPDGVTEFRVTGLVPDLRRHTGEEVEIIGTIVEAMPVGTTPTLEMKSIRTRADACGR